MKKTFFLFSYFKILYTFAASKTKRIKRTIMNNLFLHILLCGLINLLENPVGSESCAY